MYSFYLIIANNSADSCSFAWNNPRWKGTRCICHSTEVVVRFLSNKKHRAFHTIRFEPQHLKKCCFKEICFRDLRQRRGKRSFLVFILGVIPSLPDIWPSENTNGWNSAGATDRMDNLLFDSWKYWDFQY